MDGDLQKEIFRLQRYKKKADQKSDLKEVAHICNQLGELLSQNGSYAQAVEEHEKERSISNALGDKIGAAVACRKIGECHCALAQYNKALEFQHQHLVLAQECGDQVEVQRALATIGRTHLCQAETQNLKLAKVSLDKAEHSFIKALEICEMLKSSSHLTQSEYMSMKGRLFLNLGLVHDGRGSEKESAEYLKRALAIAEKYCLLEEQYLCHINMAGMYQRSNNPSMALRSLSVALATATKLNMKHNQGEVYLQMAVVNAAIANCASAKHCLKKARKFLYTTEDTARITKLFKAVTCLENATQQGKAGSNTLDMFHAYEKLGDALCAVGNFTDAISFYQKMVSCGEQLKLPADQLIPAYVSLAQTYADNKQPDFAIACYQKELQLRDQDNEQACFTWLNIADQEEMRGDGYPELCKSFNSALTYAGQANMPHLQVRVLHSLAAVQKAFKEDDDLQDTTLKLQQLQANHRIKAKEELSDEEMDSESREETDTDETSCLSDLSNSESSSEEEAIHSSVAAGTAVCRTRVRKVNEKGETQLHIACIKGNLRRVQTLLSEGGWYLWSCSGSGRTATLGSSFLLTLGHPVNVRDNCGWTPLHEAANNNHYTVAEALLEAGADINDRGGEHCNGITPLIDAASCGNMEIIQLLVDKGANVLAKDANGTTASQALQEWYRRAAETLDEDTIAQYHGTLHRLQHCEYGRSVIAKGPILSSQRTKSPHTQSSILHSGDSSGFRQHQQNNITRKTSDKIHHTEASNQDNVVQLYRSAICSLGSSTQHVLAHASARSHRAQLLSPESKQALIGEDDLVGDDWLINDLQPARQKRDRIQDKQSSRYSASQHGKRARLSLARKSCKLNEKNIPSVENNISEGGIDLEQRNILDAVCESDEESVEHLPSLLPCLSSPGEQCSETNNSESVSTLPLSEMSSKGFHSVTESHNVSPTQARELRSHHTPGNILRIRVKVEGSIFLIPTAISEQKTFGWLSEEASQRFSNYCGRHPYLTLSSSDGAILSPNDVIAMVLCDNDLIESVVNGWDQSTLSERYLQACSSSSTVAYRNIVWELKQAQTSDIVRLADLALNPHVLQPVVSALHVHTSLRELHLPGNGLGDTGLERLIQVLADLPNLHTLNLDDNGITAQGLGYLASLTAAGSSSSACMPPQSRSLHGSCNVSSPHNTPMPLQALKTLKMSHNNLGSEIADSLCTILDKLVSLQHLCLCACRLTSRLFHTSRQTLCTVLQRCSLRHLEISHNNLDSLGIEILLSCLKHCSLISLDLTKTMWDISKGQWVLHLEDFVSVSCTLQRLSLAGCHLSTKDIGIICRLPHHCPHLQCLNLSFNNAVTSSCLQDLLSCSSQNPNNHLHQVEAVSCAITSPLGATFITALAAKLNSGCPLQTFKFSCQHLEQGEQTEISHLWTLRWSHRAKIRIIRDCVLLSTN